MNVECSYCHKGFFRTDSLLQHTRMHETGSFDVSSPHENEDTEACYPDQCMIEVDVVVPGGTEGIEVPEIHIIRRLSTGSHQSNPDAAIADNGPEWSASVGLNATHTASNRDSFHAMGNSHLGGEQLPPPASAPATRKMFDQSFPISHLSFNGTKNDDGLTVRRHRSMTPSIFANSNANAGSRNMEQYFDHAQTPSTRDYHSYSTLASVAAGVAYKRHMSVQSSPGGYPTSLDYISTPQMVQHTLSRPGSSHSSPHHQMQMQGILSQDLAYNNNLNPNPNHGATPSFQPASFSRASSHYSNDLVENQGMYASTAVDRTAYYTQSSQFIATNQVNDGSAQYYSH